VFKNKNSLNISCSLNLFHWLLVTVLSRKLCILCRECWILNFHRIVDVLYISIKINIFCWFVPLSICLKFQTKLTSLCCIIANSSCVRLLLGHSVYSFKTYRNTNSKRENSTADGFIRIKSTQNAKHLLNILPSELRHTPQQLDLIDRGSTSTRQFYDRRSTCYHWRRLAAQEAQQLDHHRHQQLASGRCLTHTHSDNTDIIAVAAMFLKRVHLVSSIGQTFGHATWC